MQLSPDCTLQPTPAGVLHWLAPASRGLERQLLEGLLRRGTGSPLPSLTHTRHTPPPQPVLRALFALLRTEALSVHHRPLPGLSPHAATSSWACQGLAALQEDLSDWARPGQCLLLSGGDGLPLASVGWSAYEGSVLAARTSQPPPPGMARRALRIGPWPLQLSWTGDLDLQHPALLRLAFRLLQSHTPTPAAHADPRHAHPDPSLHVR